MSPSARRVSLLVAIGMGFFLFGALIYIEPKSLLILKRALLALVSIALGGLCYRKRQRLQRQYERLPAVGKGAIAGILLWLFFVSIWTVRRFVHFNLFVIDILASICGLAAFPVALGGWMFVWGDNGPPNPILNNMAFNIACGMTLHATIGAVLKLIFFPQTSTATPNYSD